MSENTVDRRQARNSVIKSAVCMLILGGVFYYLFYPDGLISDSSDRDISFLIAPVLSFLILMFLSRLSNYLIPSRAGLFISYALNGAAFAVFSYLFFKRAVLFTPIFHSATVRQVLYDFGKIAGYMVLIFSGSTLAKMSKLMVNSRWEKRISPAMAIAGNVLTGYYLWKSFAVFTGYWIHFNSIGWIIFVGMLVVAAGNLGSYAEKTGNELLADAGNWLHSMRSSRKFFLGVIVAVYIIFVRPILFKLSSYAFLIDWVIVCFFAWRILSGIKTRLQSHRTAPITEADWRQHVQRVSEAEDEDFRRLVNIQQIFEESGSRDELMQYLVALLKNNGLSDAAANQTLNHLIEYNDRKIPWYYIWFWRRRRQAENRMNRRKALNETVRELNVNLIPTFSHGGRKS